MNDKRVSIIMPVLNEESHIERALMSLINGSYPKELLEIIVIDGGSVDSTKSIVEKVVKSTGVNFLQLHNAQKITPVSLNIGLKASSCDVVLRADAHAVYHNDYIANSVQVLLRGDGDNVGGKIISIPSDNNFSLALAAILNSFFGNGGVSYRNSDVAKFADTVWCGCWYKTTLIDVGLFNEACKTNQDAELNLRLIKAGYKVRYDPSIVAELIVRDSYFKMLKQYFNYGIGRCRTYKMHSSSIQLRQIFPILFTVMLLVICAICPLLFVALLSYIGLISIGEKYFSFGYYSWFIPIIIGMNLAWSFGFVKYYFSSLRPSS